MPARIVLRVDKGIMPKSRRFKRPLDVLLDGMIAGDIGWGQSAQYEISAGKHELAVCPKLGGPASGLGVYTHEGETVLVRCFLVVGGAGLVLVNEGNKTAFAALRTQARANASLLTAKVFVNLIGAVAVLLGIANLLLNNGLFGLKITGVFERSAELLLNIGLLGPEINGIYWMIFGVVFLGLGYLVKKRSMLALTAAVLLYGVDGYWAARSIAALLPLFVSNDYFFVPSFVFLFFSVIFHIVFIIPMIKGIFTITAAKRREGQAPLPPESVPPS